MFASIKRKSWLIAFLALGTPGSQALAVDVVLPHYTGHVLPAVQENVGEAVFHLLEDAYEITLPDDADGAMKFAAQILTQRITEQKSLVAADAAEAGGSAPLKLRVTVEHLANATSVESTTGLDLGLAGLDLPRQGYVIRVRPRGSELNVVVLGADSRGTFYGAATLMQQIGVEGGRLGVRTNDLNDWPAWEERYFGDYLPYGSQAMAWCAINKISGYAIQARYEWRKFSPEMKPQYSQFASWADAIADMRQLHDEMGLLDYMIILHLYAGGSREYPIINLAREEDIQAFIERCRYAAESGFDHILIAADDMTRHDGTRYVCTYDEETKKFGDSIGSAQGYLVKRVYEALIEDFPRLRVSFCPAPYSLNDHRVPQLKENQRYLADMARQLPDDVAVVWTGPKVLSDHITKTDSDAYRRYVDGHRLLLWDNTNETGHPPMSVWRTRFDDAYTEESRIIYANTHLFGWPWDQVYAASANSYLWNPQRYDATAAHAEAAVQIHGPGTDDLAASFNRLKDQLDNGDEPREVKLEHVAELERLVAEMEARNLPIKHLRGFIDSRKGRLSTEIPHLAVPRFHHPIRVDGYLSDQDWAAAASFDLSAASRDKKEKYPASGMIGYDEENLYLAFTVHHSTTLRAPKIPDRRDEPIYNQSDAIELFIQPEGREDYGHIVFDFMGHLYDKHHGDETTLGLGWNPDWKLAIHRLEEGKWIAEVAIPFDSFTPMADSAPAAGTTWRVNFCRYSIHDSQLSSWSATFGKFHQTNQFGFLDFQ